MAENFYVLSFKQDVNDFEHGNWFVTPVSESADFKPLAALPQADVVTDIKRSGDTVTVTVTNRSKHVAFFNRLVAPRHLQACCMLPPGGTTIISRFAGPDKDCDMPPAVGRRYKGGHYKSLTAGTQISSNISDKVFDV